MHEISQAVRNLYADDSCIWCQHKEQKEIGKQLNKDFGNNCSWLVDNKLSIHFHEYKTNSILFASKQRSKNVCLLTIRYNRINIEQHSQVTYLGCVSDKTMGEPIALKVINKTIGN